MPINVTTMSALVVTTRATSATEFGGSCGRASHAETRISQSAIRSTRAQLHVEELHQIGNDAPVGRVGSKHVPELVRSPLRTGRQLSRTPISVPLAPEVSSQALKATLRETETVKETEALKYFSQDEHQQLQTSQPMPLAGRLQLSIYKSCGYVTVGEDAGPSGHRSSIDISVES